MNGRWLIKDEWGLYRLRKSGGEIGEYNSPIRKQPCIRSKCCHQHCGASDDWTESGVNGLVYRPEGDSSQSMGGQIVGAHVLPLAPCSNECGRLKIRSTLRPGTKALEKHTASRRK